MSPFPMAPHPPANAWKRAAGTPSADRDDVVNERRATGVYVATPRERIDEGDDLAPRPTSDELNDFLIRRQLLAMESSRIEGLRPEADEALLGKQNEFAHLRDNISAFLRDHRNHELRAQGKHPDEKRTIKTLLRRGERYLRRRLRRRFKRSESALDSTGIDPSPGADFGWILPAVRDLDSWRLWLAEYDRSSRESAPFRKDRIQVAFVVSGGIGDFLKSTHLLAPLSHRFSCDLTVIAAQGSARQIVARNPYVRDALIPASEHSLHFVDRLRHIPVFDLIVVWKYIVEYVTPPGSRLPANDIRSLESESSGVRQALDKYCFQHGWPKFNFAFSREATRRGLSAIHVSAATSGLHDRNLDETPFFVARQSLGPIVGFMRKPYVTVHHGFDVNYLPAKTRETDYASTKNLSMRQWREIVALLRKEGFEVIQLGVAEEEGIEGVTHRLNGLTSLEETALLIKHGLCHIDTEGGLVHLANAVHARSVVLFGPTPVSFFGYPRNINIEPSGCKACWFSTQTWLVECPRHTSGPECMRQHSAEVVVDAAKQVVAETETPAVMLLAAKARNPIASFSEALAKAENLLDREMATRALLVVDEPPIDLELELSEDALGRYDVILCGDKLAQRVVLDRGARGIDFGSVLNLPRPSASVDVAIWISRDIEADIAPFALREFLRVLKFGGYLAIVVAGEGAGADLSRMLSAAQIEFDRDSLPVAPVGTCLFRKIVAQRDKHRLDPRLAGPTGPLGMVAGRSAEQDARLAPIEEDNDRKIVLLRDTYERRERVIVKMNAVVDDAIQRGFGRDGWIWPLAGSGAEYMAKFFLRGWRPVAESGVWSREMEETCVLMAPYPADNPSSGQALEAQIHVVIPEASASEPRTIRVRVDGGPIVAHRVATEDTILTLSIPTSASRFRGVSEIEFLLSSQQASEGLHELTRVGVKKFRYRFPLG